MGRKPKVSYEDKIKACEDYINGTARAIQIAERLNLGKGVYKLIYELTNKDRINGLESLLPLQRNNSYNRDLKIEIVQEYLSAADLQASKTNRINFD